ncbi:hypothetical protein GHC21_03625 [Kluyvera intermedia]|uniref:Uncharacterized protein n=1 Tax=Kluyvera intermedia TaxID=61648 RepID=A0ABX6DP76_KLUIN|nr:hypothetical protein GHC21_03625 [Kluyvera intermedia]QGH37802.1 hypothetical protein GHC38_03625 [Kluyvera intermedia]
MSLQEEELVSARTEQGSHAPSLLDEIMAQTRIQPGADGYDIARQGVTAFVASLHTDTEDNPFTGGLFSQFRLSDTLY